MAYQESVERNSESDVVPDLDKAKNEAIAAHLGPNASATAVSMFGNATSTGSSKDATFIDEAAMTGFNGTAFGKVMGFAYSAYSANAGSSVDLMGGNTGGKRGRSNSLHIENTSASSSFGAPTQIQKSPTPLVDPGYLGRRKAANANAGRKENMIMGVNNAALSTTMFPPKNATITAQNVAMLCVSSSLRNELNSLDRAQKDPSASRLAKGLREGHEAAENYVNANPNNLNTNQAVKMTASIH